MVGITPDAKTVIGNGIDSPYTIPVRKEHLENFPNLIKWIRQEGYGASGAVVLRLNESDRLDCLPLITKLLNDAFQEKRVDEITQIESYKYPEEQMFLKCAERDHIYQYIVTDCLPEDRNGFVQKATDLHSYTESDNGCCDEAFELGGSAGVVNHIFDEVSKVAVMNETVSHDLSTLKCIQSKRKESRSKKGHQETPSQIPKKGFLYAAGIQLHRTTHINICDGFSLSKLGTVLDDMKEQYDGISFPFMYVGTRHAIFVWHIEDGGMFSINYLFIGKKKVWFIIHPKYFGFIDLIVAGLRIARGHTSCRYVLGDHKCLYVHPEIFGKLGARVMVIVQEPGDFVITFPYALHSGFNMGANIAMASNFGDEEWLEVALYNIFCDCFPDRKQVHLNLTDMLRRWRPDLLETYLAGAVLVPPPGHPRRVVWPAQPKENEATAETASAAEVPALTASVAEVSAETPSAAEVAAEAAAVIAPHDQAPGTLQHVLPRTPRLKDRVLFCPVCKKKFTNNKLGRLREHITKVHSKESSRLLKVVKELYPEWQPKSCTGFTCNVCKKFNRQSVTHLKLHHNRFHPDIHFTLPAKPDKF